MAAWEIGANYLLAGLIGVIVGAVELLGRYRDNPLAALRERAALAYIAVNATASLLAYHIVLVFDIRFGFDPETPEKLALMQVLLAGLAAMAFFRTSLFTMRLAETDIPVGPGLVLQILLNVTDRAVDRGRALPRAQAVPQLMASIDFDRAKDALPSFCFGIMQNIGTEEQAASRSQVAIISESSLSPALKASLLGLLLTNLVGFEVLRSAVESLGGEIAHPPQPVQPTPPQELPSQ
jgi:hypothetical protein